jgi:hypothetical protein
MAAKTIEIQGMREARQQIEKLRGSVAGRQLQDLLVEGAKMITSEAERLAPRGETGNLRQSFRASAGKVARTFAQAFGFTLARLAPHAHLVEFGTKPHEIKAKGKFLRLEGGAFAKLVRHPGARPDMFFRDAVRSKRTAVRRHIEAGLKQILERGAA